MIDIGPRWVLVNNKPYDVSNFAHLKPADRPQAICPVCRRTVILKLGAVKTHHYAHRSEDECIASQSETALHLNTKFYIAEQLRNASEVIYYNRCTGFCSKYNRIALLQEWDDVKVECTIGKYRLDIGFLKNNKVIGGIEIFVTHRIDENKIRFLNEQAIPWLEIQASPNLYEGADAWHPVTPLPILRQNPKPNKYLCKKCHHRRIEEQKRRTREAQRRNENKILFARMVDFYYPSGKKWRETIYIKRAKTHKGEMTIACTRDGSERKPIYKISGPITEEKLELLKEAVNRWILNKVNSYRAVVDEFMEWHDWNHSPRPHPRNTDRFPFRKEFRSRVWVDLNLQTSTQGIEERLKSLREIRVKECPCRECGEIVSYWLSYDPISKTCICRYCAFGK